MSVMKQYSLQICLSRAKSCMAVLMFSGLFDSTFWALSTFNDESKGLSATHVDDFASVGMISFTSMSNSAAISLANSYLLSHDAGQMNRSRYMAFRDL